jgi:hypothetical protein
MTGVALSQLVHGAVAHITSVFIADAGHDACGAAQAVSLHLVVDGVTGAVRVVLSVARLSVRAASSSGARTAIARAARRAAAAPGTAAAANARAADDSDAADEQSRAFSPAPQLIEAALMLAVSALLVMVLRERGVPLRTITAAVRRAAVHAC